MAEWHKVQTPLKPKKPPTIFLCCFFRQKIISRFFAFKPIIPFGTPLECTRHGATFLGSYRRGREQVVEKQGDASKAKTWEKYEIPVLIIATLQSCTSLDRPQGVLQTCFWLTNSSLRFNWNRYHSCVLGWTRCQWDLCGPLQAPSQCERDLLLQMSDHHPQITPRGPPQGTQTVI